MREENKNKTFWDDLKSWFKNKNNHQTIKKIILICLFFIFTFLIFSLGILVGETKARFYYSWLGNYNNNFRGPKMGFENFKNFPPRFNLMHGYGLFGEVIEIGYNDLVLKDENGIEKIIILRDNTLIKRNFSSIKKDDLKNGDKIMVIGSPNDQGQVEAKFIRVF
jgi:hypothetical protein